MEQFLSENGMYGLCDKNTNEIKNNMNTVEILNILYKTKTLNNYEYLRLKEETRDIHDTEVSYSIVKKQISFTYGDITSTLKIKSGLTRHQKRLLRNVEITKFKLLFNFYVDSYNKGILTFCGSDVITTYNKLAFDAKMTFKLYENGMFNNLEKIETTEPELLRQAILGKRSWGLWLNEWSAGIAESTFTKFEIIHEFNKLGIKLPTSLNIDFDNTIYRKRKTSKLKYGA